MDAITTLLAGQRIHDMHRQAERVRFVRSARTRHGLRSRFSKRGN